MIWIYVCHYVRITTETTPLFRSNTPTSFHVAQGLDSIQTDLSNLSFQNLDSRVVVDRGLSISSSRIVKQRKNVPRETCHGSRDVHMV